MVRLARDNTTTEETFIKVLALNEEEAKYRIKEALDKTNIEYEMTWTMLNGGYNNDTEIVNVSEYEEGDAVDDDLDELLEEETENDHSKGE